MRKYRETAKLTQQALAERSSLSLRTIQKLEAGQTPRLSTLGRVAKALSERISEVKGKSVTIRIEQLLDPVTGEPDKAAS